MAGEYWLTARCRSAVRCEGLDLPTRRRHLRSTGTRGELKGYSRGTQGVLKGYSTGAGQANDTEKGREIGRKSARRVGVFRRNRGEDRKRVSIHRCVYTYIYTDTPIDDIRMHACKRIYILTHTHMYICLHLVNQSRPPTCGRGPGVLRGYSRGTAPRR